MSIQPLPPLVQAQLRSSIQIHTLIDVVEELVRNSLDAAATWLEIEVDFTRGYCSVVDDGVGIPVDEFRDGDGGDGGHLARLGCTSKRDNPLAYGRRGCFLADLASLSRLSISSRQLGACQSAGLIVGVVSGSGSGEVSRNSSVADADADADEYYYPGDGRRRRRRRNHGTKVVVHNLFGNLPVRFKHFALRYAVASEERRAFNDLKRRLVSYLLASAAGAGAQRPVNIRLRNRNGNLLFTHRSPTRNSDCDGDRMPTFALESIENIFKQADLVPRSGTGSSTAWKLASAQAGDISIRTAICLLPSPSKHAQFISIGHQPLSYHSGNAPLSCFYDTINQLFDSSEFSAVSLLHDEDRQVPGQLQTKHKMMSKGAVDRWPRFYVRIDARSSTLLSELRGAKMGDPSQTPPAPIMTINRLLKSLFTAFLKSQNVKVKTAPCQGSREPVKLVAKTLPGPASIFDTWKRVKYSAEYDDRGIKHRMPFSSQDQDVGRLLSDMELESGANSPQEDGPASPPDDEGDPSREDTIKWTDPRTNKVVCVNRCTGFVVPPTSALSVLPISMKRTERLEQLKQSRSALTERLKNWPTMVYQSREEKPIPSLNHDCDAQCAKTAPFSEISVVNLDITAKDLANARVLGQIDAKFILAVVGQDHDDDTPPALLMVDQHAADERVKVEQLFAQLCAHESVELAVPLNFEVTVEEENRLLELRGYFARWAIQYEMAYSGKDKDKEKDTIRVTHLPAVIAERCRLKPRLLIELLRKAVWGQDSLGTGAGWIDNDNNNDADDAMDDSDGDGWISKLSQCPKGLIEMVNSRACRTAIMFNDVLSKGQCQSLLRQLAGCKLPFQCAHGRPSMTLVALTLTSVGSHLCRLNGGESAIGREEREEEDFGTAYRKWCRTNA